MSLNKLVIVCSICMASTVSLAQTGGSFQSGSPLPAAQLNSAFSGKTDWPTTSSTVPGVSGVTFSGTPAVGDVPIATSSTVALWGPLVYNITNFGAKCDGVADDTAAINAAAAAARNSVTYFNLGVVKIVGPGRPTAVCNVTSVNATGFVRRSGALIIFEGLPLSCSGTANICFDRTASIYTVLKDSTINGSCTPGSIPSVGLQDSAGTPAFRSANVHTDHVTVNGCFTRAALYNMSSEVNNYSSSFFANLYTGSSNSFGCVFDGANHWGATSTYQTITFPIDSNVTQTRVDFIGSVCNDAGGGDPLWLNATNGYTFINTYLFNGGMSARSVTSIPAAGTNNNIGDLLTMNDGCPTHTILQVTGVSGGGVTSASISQPGSCTTAPSNPVSVSSTTGSGTGETFNLSYAGHCIDLYDENQGANQSLHMDVHCEQYTTSSIFLTGPNNNPTLPTFSYEDGNPFAANELIETDTNIVSVTAQGFNFKIPRTGSALPIFSNASVWTISGSIHLPSTAYWTAAPASMTGRVCLGSGCAFASPVANNADSTVLGGNARGANSVDWQTTRFQANQVASGAQSTIAGGFANVTSGQYSAITGGNSNIATGFASRTGGIQTDDRGRHTTDCWGPQMGYQTCVQILRGSTASASALRLTSDAAGANLNNCVNLQQRAGLAYAVTINIAAIDVTTPTNSIFWNAWTGEIDRPTNAASTHVAMNATPTPLTNGMVTGSAIAASADTTGDACLNLSFTPPTGNTDTWHVSARVQSVEVQ
jgi:hypothetical protein